MVVSSPQNWKMVMTQQLMSPTCPITTWFHLRQTFWTEPLYQAFSASVLDCMSSCRPLCRPPVAKAAAQPGPPRVLRLTRPGCPESGGTGALHNHRQTPRLQQQEAMVLQLCGAFYLHSALPACLFPWDALFLRVVLPLVLTAYLRGAFLLVTWP